MTTSDVLKASFVAHAVTGKRPRYGKLNPVDFAEVEKEWDSYWPYLRLDCVLDAVRSGTIKICGVVYSKDPMITPGLVRFND